MGKLLTELMENQKNLDYSGDNAHTLSVLHLANRSRNRVSMSGEELAGLINQSEYRALSEVQKDRLQAWIDKDNFDPFSLIEEVLKGFFARSAFMSMFNAQSPTLLAFVNARVETISRVTEANLGRVKMGHIEETRRPPRELGVTCEFDNEEAMRHSIATRLGTMLCDRHRALIVGETEKHARERAKGRATSLTPSDILASVYKDLQEGKL